MSSVEKVFDTGHVDGSVFVHCLRKGIGEVSMVLSMTKEKYEFKGSVKYFYWKKKKEDRFTENEARVHTYIVDDEFRTKFNEVDL